MKILAFIKRIGWLGWLFVALLIALSIWAVKCSRKKPEPPTRQYQKPPVTLSNEVPADEKSQEAIVDSLNQQNH